jgi:hypothetical protein
VKGASLLRTNQTTTSRAPQSPGAGGAGTQRIPSAGADRHYHVDPRQDGAPDVRRMHGDEQDLAELRRHARRMTPYGRQHVVGLVDDDPVRPPVQHPHRLQLRQQLGAVCGTVLELDPEQVHVHVHVRILQHRQHFAHSRRVVLVADRGEALEAHVVALGIEDADLVVARDEPLDHRRGKARLAAARGPGDEQAASVRGYPDRPAVGTSAERDGRPARARLNVLEIVRDQRVDQLHHPCIGLAGGDESGNVLDRGDGIRHGHRTLGQVKKRMVVLRVAYADHLVRRHPEPPQCILHAARLVDARRQHHDCLTVEDDLQLETELADRLHHRGLVRHVRRHDDLPDLEGFNAARLQRPDELRR